MANPSTNDELREQGSLTAKLEAAVKQLGQKYAENLGFLDAINDIEAATLKKSKDISEDKQKQLNLQKDISELVSELNEKSKDAVMYDTRLRKLVIEIRDKKLEELKIGESIAKQEKFKASLIDASNTLGLKKAVDLAIQFRNTWKDNPFLAVLNLSAKLISDFLDIFRQVDGAAADFRKNMGFVRNDTVDLEKNVRNTYFRLAQVGVEAKNLYASYEEVNKALGTSQATTLSMARDMSLMNVQLGVAQGTSAEFSKAMGMMAKNTMDSQNNISLFTAKLSAAAGTNLNEVMSDVANAAKSSYQFMIRNPAALAKSAVEAKKMGTSISEAAKSAETLINFTQSVEAEMRASVLLGESINLQRARELSYRKDLAGLNKEILEIAKKAKFEELDPFQQEAVAKALGKSANELGKMLQADREMRRIRADGSLSKQVAEYDNLKNANDALVKSTAENAREQLQLKSNLEATKAISVALKSIYQSMFQPLVDLAVKVLPPIANFFAKINAEIGGWSAAILGFTAIFGTLVGSLYIGKLVGWLKGRVLTLLGKDLAESAKVGGDAVAGKGGLVDKIVNGMQGVEKIATSIGRIIIRLGTSVGRGIGNLLKFTLIGLAAGLKALGDPKALIGAIVLGVVGLAFMAFGKAAQFLALALKSLQDVDLMSMAGGLALIGVAMIPLALVSPFLLPLAIGMAAFGLALRFAAGPVERMGIASLQLGTGLEKTAESMGKIADLSLTTVVSQFKDLAEIISGISKAVNAMPDIKIEKLQSIMVKAGEIGAAQAEKSNEEIIKALQDVKAAIDQMRVSLEKGGIMASVSIDSQRVDSSMARALAFKGTLSPQPNFS